MMNKARQQVNKARKAGMSAADVLRMREIAKKSAMEMEAEATEKAFLFMLTIPLNVLFNDYWSKTAKKKAPKFIEDVLSLYDSVQSGAVTQQELNELIWDLAGVKVDAEWMKLRKGVTENE